MSTIKKLVTSGNKDLAKELQKLNHYPNPPMPKGKGVDPEDDNDLANPFYDYGKDYPFKRTNPTLTSLKKFIKTLKIKANISDKNLKDVTNKQAYIIHQLMEKAGVVTDNKIKKQLEKGLFTLLNSLYGAE